MTYQNICDFGAVADGATLNTTAIQRAIDTAAADGGSGHVVIPRGNFLTGPSICVTVFIWN
ncbi:MAG: hypothetical protein LR015_03075 [Verrucomicrobia bacterium]|nr:hypothetical protein [Verrucomicrobiota bacterium]